eukprot:CAMPEP_0195050762 /NCGR_PEP_ID=MMETSP0448-20130528/362_1 /TAXON_ID=66468 /ORGANISM="Heterocapsa triquestra, Strain CCMP 448" /LENGTH=62 /DNA_ID=CAMNT_0040079693 /DNA_START=11 /DNA_END=199 /DNA_ORIENTATION=-
MTKELQDELMKVGQAAYANTGAEGAAQPPPGDAGAPPPGGAGAPEGGDKKKKPDDFIDVDAQ